jgi:hypothetical protein
VGAQTARQHGDRIYLFEETGLTDMENMTEHVPRTVYTVFLLGTKMWCIKTKFLDMVYLVRGICCKRLLAQK